MPGKSDALVVVVSLMDSRATMPLSEGRYARGSSGSAHMGIGVKCVLCSAFWYDKIC